MMTSHPSPTHHTHVIHSRVSRKHQRAHNVTNPNLPQRTTCGSPAVVSYRPTMPERTAAGNKGGKSTWNELFALVLNVNGHDCFTGHASNDVMRASMTDARMQLHASQGRTQASAIPPPPAIFLTCSGIEPAWIRPGPSACPIRCGSR